MGNLRICAGCLDVGNEKSRHFTGHIASEEAGMEYCATWMKTFIPDIPITYIENGSSYWSVQKPSMQSK